MNSINLMKARLTASGGKDSNRAISQKRRGFEASLKQSYQAETVTFMDKQYKALINSFKNKMDYDDKIISIGYDCPIAVGDTFLWERVNKRCIVYLQERTESAYFRGYFRVAEYMLKWKDELGIERNGYAAVRGPVETVVRGQMKKNTAYDQPNHSLDIIIQDSVHTRKLKRYTRVALEGKAWEITAVDAISEPGVINLSLVEDFINRENDSSEMINDKITIDIQVSSTLDSISELNLNIPTKLDTTVMVNGKKHHELELESEFSIVSGTATIENNSIIFKEEESSIIQLSIPSINFIRTFTIAGVDNVAIIQNDYKIEGNLRVKSFGSGKYVIKKYINGQEVIPNGLWHVVGNAKLFKIVSQDNTSIVLKWTTGLSGSIVLQYTEGLETHQLEITIESLV